MSLIQRITVEGVSAVAARPENWNGETAFVLGHGAGQSMDSPFMSFFHSGIRDLGYLSVKFNFPYMEAGRRAPDSQPKLRACYTAVVDRVLGDFRPHRLVLGGKSMGGRVASYIAGSFDQVGGLVFLGYPLHPAGRTDTLRDTHLYELDCPMLFISGTRDSLAREDLLGQVVERIGRRATLHRIEGGDHSFRVRKSDARSLPEALDAIARWMLSFQ